MTELNLDRSTYTERPFTMEGVVVECRLKQETDMKDDPRFFHDDCGYDRDQPYGGRFSCGEDSGCQRDEPMVSLHWVLKRDDERGSPWRDDGCEEWKVPYSTKPRGQPYSAHPSKGSAFDREQEAIDKEFARLNVPPISVAEDFAKIEGNRVQFQVVKGKTGKYYYRFMGIIDK